MSTLLPLFAVVVALVAGLAVVSIWAPRRLAMKLAALGLALACMPTAYAAMMGLLSMPKPASFEWWLDQAEEATVLGSSIKEDQAIYLWLQIDSAEEPRAYVLPWNRRMAEELQEAARQAEEARSALRMRLPFEPSLDEREPRFYALPQPALPPKDQLDPPPAQLFQPPGREA